MRISTDLSFLTFDPWKCKFMLQDSSENPVLHVQHCVPLHDDVHTDGACLLYASWLWGEDCSWSHSHPRFLCLHVGHCRENARDQWIHTTNRYLNICQFVVNSQLKIMFSVIIYRYLSNICDGDDHSICNNDCNSSKLLLPRSNSNWGAPLG